ncbi:MAG: hypothetical protein AB7I19_13620 [Planctomycetota bacterium]
MPKRSSKRGKKLHDVDSLAAAIMAEATDDAPKVALANSDTTEASDGKNPAAVALGRLGGLKGGKARAKKLSKNRRSEIAKKAAQKRWGHAAP